ncbi:MAG: four helix bundle protein [Planctomycetota bacterium]
MSYEDEKESFGFSDLDVYKAAREYRKRVYKLVRQLPKEEIYALGMQMRRAAVSISSNIAEGHGRYNWQDNTRFCRIAKGSLAETVDGINVCIDETYAAKEHLDDLKKDAANLLRLLNGYIRYLQKQRAE